MTHLPYSGSLTDLLIISSPETYTLSFVAIPSLRATELAPMDVFRRSSLQFDSKRVSADIDEGASLSARSLFSETSLFKLAEGISVAS